MCGITAMLGQPDSEVLKGMVELLGHRGPDGNGIWNDDECGLGHSRLAIVDIDGSKQPMGSDDGRVLVVNGEIYNHQSIRSSMRDYSWRTKGDSESILALHSRFPDWVSRLDGIFAICLWDPNAKELTLARDPLGVKPLLRTIVDDTLLVASEAKAFRAHEEYTPAMDIEALKTRIAFEYPLDDTSLFVDVEQVSPGTYEVWGIDDGKAVLRERNKYKHWKLEPDEEWNDPQGLLDSLTRSIADRLMSDVPVGVVLSGGLDSALVAALGHQAAELAGQPVPECWTVAEDEDNPDWLAAELVTSQLDLVHHQRILEADSFHSAVPDMCWHGEDLDVTVMFFQPLFQTMAKDVTVGLCGQGADELHAGYPRYRDLEEHRNLIAGRLNKMGIEHDLNGFETLQSSLQFELDHGQLSNFQLRLVDRHSMAHGLEVRVPFLGAEHVEASRKLPMDERLPKNGVWGQEKHALRKAAKLSPLPDEVVMRPKLPAGRATAPKMLEDFLEQMMPRANELMDRYTSLAKGLQDQPEIALGLGLFESMHIIDRGLGRKNLSIEGLIDEIL